MVRSMPLLLLMLSMGFHLAQLTVVDPCAPKPGGGGVPGPGGDSPPHEPTKCHEEDGICINPHCDTCPPETHVRADFCPGHRVCCVPGRRPPFGCCELFNDPHIRTFDSHPYDVQSLGEFDISKPCNGNEFKISAKFVRPYPGASWSQIGQVTIDHSGSTSLVIDGYGGVIMGGNLMTPNVWIANNQVFIYQIGVNIYVLLSKYKVLVCYNPITMELRVYVDRRWENKLCGLCDNFNGDASDDGSAAAPATVQGCPKARTHPDWQYCERELQEKMKNCSRINTRRYKRFCAIDMCLGGTADAAFTLGAAEEHCNGPDVMEQMNQEPEIPGGA